MPPTSQSTPPRSARRRPILDLDAYEQGVLAGDRAVLARAFTLVESSRRDHQQQAQNLLARLLPHTGKARRIGITGVPGAGKSTFIEALGSTLTAEGRKVAVLAIDPSSALSGGSILGDKTRMTRLASDPQAFVRPSPSGGSLGGVARKTREGMLLCEAAGYDVVLVETVGVGQAETMVSEMVDSVLLLLVPGAGDELQGIKRGILELIDLVVMNKADGDRVTAAKQARNQYAKALRFVRPRHACWTPPVKTCSALENEGLDEVWETLEEHHRALLDSGALDARRREQRSLWLWSLIETELHDRFRRAPAVAEMLPRIEADVLAGASPPTRAAERLLTAFFDPSRDDP